MLRLEGLTKRFPGVLALDHVDLDVADGEMHALAGENGAGKSSLIRLLAGIHRPDAGRMTLAGAPYAPARPLDAIAVGVRVVHQEFNLLPALSVAENLLFERLPRRLGFVDRRALDRRAEALLARVPVSDRRAGGSSLMFCVVAEGEADVYPRFGPTMEWDTAAADAVLRAAGGTVLKPDGSPFRYGKAEVDYRNGAFVAWGAPTAAERSGG